MASNGIPPVIRCAIYTRKSTEEGLEQNFNSLDAQRDAGENGCDGDGGSVHGLVPACEISEAGRVADFEGAGSRQAPPERRPISDHRDRRSSRFETLTPRAGSGVPILPFMGPIEEAASCRSLRAG